MKGHNSIISMVVLCYLLKLSASQSLENAQNLSMQLFTTNNYNYRFRPVNDQSTTIEIYTELYLLAVNSIDEVTETMKTTGYLSMIWTDELLSWDTSDYGGIQYLYWPQNEVWKPDITLKNSFKEYKQLGDSSLNVIIQSDGQVRWAPFQVFESTCGIDITYFPFDTQICSLKFMAWSYTKDEIQMEGDGNGVSLDEYEENSAWEITKTSWATLTDGEDSSITFSISLRRKPLYNMLTLVFPVIMLAILDLLVFVLPCESGEKAGYAVTVFLAFAVFLTIMEASFPQNSETIAIFAIYVVIETVQSTLITFLALLMVRVSTFEEKTPVPKWLICIVRISKCKHIRENIGRNKIRTENNETVLSIPEKETGELEKKKDLSKEEEEESTPLKIYTWKNVVNALDVFFFVFFTLTFLVSTCVCLMMANSNQQ